MKSFLSSLRQLDSSNDVLRDRIASRRQSQLFTALSQVSGTINRSIKKRTVTTTSQHVSLTKSLVQVLTGLVVTSALFTVIMLPAPRPAIAQVSSTDADGDGTPNVDDIDDDNDGILDVNEMAAAPSAANGNFSASSSPITTITANKKYTQTAGGVTITYTNINSTGTIAPYTESTVNSNELYATGTSISYVYPFQGAKQEMTFSQSGVSKSVYSKFYITDIDQSGENHIIKVYDQNGNLIANPASYVRTTAEGTSGASAPGTATQFTGIGSNVLVTSGTNSVTVTPNPAANSNTFLRSRIVFFDFSGIQISKIEVENAGTAGQPGFLFDVVAVPRDTDGDGIPDHLDIDSDNDGITDNVEAQTTAAYKAPTGIGIAITDIDQDGLDDRYDANTSSKFTSTSVGLTPVDTDSDGTKDYLDGNSDGDSLNDIAERGDGQPTSVTSTTDTDGDGLLNIFEGSSTTDFFDVNDENLDASGNFNLADIDNDTAANGAGAVPLTADLDYRDVPSLDRSDAPVSYGEATHVIINGIKLGAAIDRDAASIANATASGDGTDDDGISSFATLTAGATSYSIPAANITATGTGTLHAWIDFNKNGTFDAGEYKSVAVTNNVPAAPLNWTGITAGAAGNTFARFRFTSDATITASTPSGSATNGEVEDYQVAIAAPDPNTIVPTGSFCQSSGGTPGINQMSSEFGGTFGTLASGYRNVQNPPIGYTYKNQTSTGASYGLTSGTAAINNGPNGIVTLTPSSLLVLYDAATYTVTSQSGSGQNLNPFGPWRAVTGVTTGLPNDAFLAVNGDVAVGDFVIQPITVQPNTNYEFGVWAMNVHGTNSPYGGVGSEPNVGLEIVGITNVETGLLTKGANWKRGSILFNSGNRTSVTLKMRNITTQVVGNDFYVDGMFAAQCSGLPVGNVTGIVYTDTNGDGTQDAGELGIAGTTLTLKDKNGVPVTTTTDSTGSYTFSNIADLAALENYSVTVDSTSTPLVGKTNTTPILTNNINVVAGTTIAGGNYGFKPPASNPNLLLVKRITAINPGQPDAIQFNNFINDNGTTNDNNLKWPDSDSNPGNNINNYLRGAVSFPQIKPGDEVEYTIYFLSNGDADAKNIKICDVVPDNMTFNKNSYGTEFGMSLALNSTTLPSIPNKNLSNLIDTDEGSFYAPGTNPLINLCKKHDPNNPNNLISVDSSNNLSGAVLINLSTPLPPATAPGTPPDSYGFVRFRAKVK